MAGRAVKSEGNLISSADSLLTSVQQPNPAWVRFALGEGDLAKFPARRVTANAVQRVELVLPDGSVSPTRGKLNFVASNIDTTLGTQQLRAEFDNSEQQILPASLCACAWSPASVTGCFWCRKPPWRRVSRVRG